MFDIGFTELMIISLVALVVVGPERLPRVARTVGHLLGRMQRYVTDVKSDINREIQLDELKNLRSEVQQAAQKLETSVNEEVRQTERNLNGVLDTAAREVQSAGGRPVEAPPGASTQAGEEAMAEAARANAAGWQEVPEDETATIQPPQPSTQPEAAVKAGKA